MGRVSVILRACEIETLYLSLPWPFSEKIDDEKRDRKIIREITAEPVECTFFDILKIRLSFYSVSKMEIILKRVRNSNRKIQSEFDFPDSSLNGKTISMSTRMVVTVARTGAIELYKVDR